MESVKFKSEATRYSKLSTREWINCSPSRLPNIVHVQDDEVNRLIWKTVAKKLGLRLASYGTAEKFLDDLDQFQNDTQFYFEFYLGDGHFHGLDLAHRVNSRLKAEVFLTTSLPKRNFVQEIEKGIIKNVIGRTPWPFTQENFFNHDLTPYHWTYSSSENDIAPIVSIRDN
jgi:hypothetical protein